MVLHIEVFYWERNGKKYRQIKIKRSNHGNMIKDNTKCAKCLFSGQWFYCSPLFFKEEQSAACAKKTHISHKLSHYRKSHCSTKT